MGKCRNCIAKYLIHASGGNLVFIGKRFDESYHEGAYKYLHSRFGDLFIDCFCD